MATSADHRSVAYHRIWTCSGVVVARSANTMATTSPAMTSALVDQKAVSLVESNMIGRYRSGHRLGSHECNKSCGGALLAGQAAERPSTPEPDAAGGLGVCGACALG